MRPVASNLSSILNSVRKLALRILSPKTVEGTMHVTPTGDFQGYTGRITFEEPEISQKDKGYVSVDNLLEIASAALSVAGYKVWMMIDRLDVAFDESSELEKNALRALFRTYRDTRNLDSVEVKIFLRTDIWRRITEEGFREATHLSSRYPFRMEQARITEPNPAPLDQQLQGSRSLCV